MRETGQALLETCLACVLATVVCLAAAGALRAEWSRFRCERRLFEKTLAARGSHASSSGGRVVGIARCGSGTSQVELSEIESWDP